jgi:ubiquitin C-terminal hydrolase
MLKLNHSALPQPFGLHNTGSICYFNSLLQGLVTCTSFIETLRNIKNKNDIVNDILELKDSSSILKHLQQKYTYFGHGQESASEGLVLLLELIDNEDVYMLFNHIYEERIVCVSCTNILSSKRENSIHFLLFDMEKLNKIGLSKYILEFYNTIYDYKGVCTKCNREKFTRCYRLKYLPEIVICILNRYDERIPTELPATFSLTDLSRLPLIYKKIAEIDHYGRLSGGHYVCRALRQDGLVYMFNDSNISISELHTKPETYITFYHHSFE